MNPLAKPKATSSGRCVVGTARRAPCASRLPPAPEVPFSCIPSHALGRVRPSPRTARASSTTPSGRTKPATPAAFRDPEVQACAARGGSRAGVRPDSDAGAVRAPRRHGRSLSAGVRYVHFGAPALTGSPSTTATARHHRRSRGRTAPAATGARGGRTSPGPHRRAGSRPDLAVQRHRFPPGNRATTAGGPADVPSHAGRRRDPLPDQRPPNPGRPDVPDVRAVHPGALGEDVQARTRRCRRGEGEGMVECSVRLRNAVGVTECRVVRSG